MVFAVLGSPWLRWALVAVVFAGLAAQLRFRTDLTGVLAEDRPVLLRTAAFFNGPEATRLFAVEAGADDQAVAVAELERVRAALAPVGARPVSLPRPGQAARLLDAVHHHLPLLVPLEIWPDIRDRMSTEALRARLQGLVALLRQGDTGLAAPLAYRDLLGLGTGVLRALEDTQTGLDPERGIALHADGRHASLLFTVDFPPVDAAHTLALMDVVDEQVAAAASRGVALATVGSYRHFADNHRRLISAIFLTMPVSVVLIALLVWSLVRRVRAIVGLHLPAVGALLGGLAALVVAYGGHVPLLLVGFGAGILGVAIDYGLHMAQACQDDGPAAVRRELLVSFATSGAAFAMLAFSPVPVVRGIGIFLVAGLAVALVVSLDLVPAVIRREARPRPAWRPVVEPLAGWMDRATLHRWWLVAAVTAVCLPGLWLLRFVEDLRRYDGSTIRTHRELDAFQERWGRLGGSDFLVADGPDLDTALAHAETVRAAHGLPAGMVDLVLPSRAEQQRRHQAWNGFWSQNATIFTRNLAIACQSAGLREAAFAPSLARYAPLVEAPVVDLTTWAETPLAPLLERAVFADPNGGVRLAAPLTGIDPDALADLGVAIDAGGDAPVWVASRKNLGRYLVDSVRDELERRGGLIVVVMFAVLLAAQRRPRAFLAIAVPPALALTWTFGVFGLLGLELMPFHVLVAAFVAGIGVDDALFLARPERRRRALAPVLATTVTTVCGVGALSLSPHPIQRTVGLAIVVGMIACLAACLLASPLLSRSVGEATAD